jgi:hypothetical protein
MRVSVFIRHILCAIVIWCKVLATIRHISHKNGCNGKLAFCAFCAFLWLIYR